LAQTLDRARASGLPIHVVTRPDNPAARALCARLQLSLTLLASRALGDSIAAGVAATAQWDGWLIHLADMPHVRSASFLAVAAALAQHDIVRPSYRDQAGHPVGFGARHRKALLGLRGQEGARAILAASPVYPLPLDDPGLTRDIDRPQDLNR
jgi:molybdenum cofactor cytidylyltransferase